MDAFAPMKIRASVCSTRKPGGRMMMSLSVCEKWPIWRRVLSQNWIESHDHHRKLQVRKEIFAPAMVRTVVSGESTQDRERNAIAIVQAHWQFIWGSCWLGCSKDNSSSTTTNQRRLSSVVDVLILPHGLFFRSQQANYCAIQIVGNLRRSKVCAPRGQV